jgi:medium-chain acyl-[acyl-carrier-protein] hydrolase
MQLLLPILRADFAVLETYTYTNEPPLEFPITAFGGLQDKKVSAEDLVAWSEQTTTSLELQMFPGDHFFLHSAQPLLLQSIARQLNMYSHL